MPTSLQRSGASLRRLRSDKRLVGGAKQGDRRAFEAIFERYHQNLYRFCLTLVGNRQDAEDALQATMVKMLRALPGEQRDIELKPWIYRIARNESIDTIRRRRETAALVSEQVAAGPGLVETAEARERLGRLIDDLGELPERQRAALVMRELADLEFTEIGSALDTSPNAARQAVYEARVSLRQMEAGREMRCDEVVWAVSEDDGRVVRRREIQAHLKGCADCRAFQESIAKRRGELRAIAPLPVAASAALVQGLGAASGGAGGGIAGAAGAGAGKALLGSTIVKTAATCAIVAAIGATAADRSGLVKVAPGGSSGQAEEGPPRSHPPLVRSSVPLQAKRHAAAATAPAGRSRAGRSESDGSARGRRAGQESTRAGLSTHANPQATPTAPPQESRSHATPRAPKPKKNAAKRGQGKSPGVPSSSAHSQQTATAHKSPHANSSPGTPRGSAKGQAPPLPPQPKPPTESPPVKEPPVYGKGGNSASRATGKPTVEAEPPESPE